MIGGKNLFSVIMPVYNGERFIENAIKSVLAQTVSDWELIIINDGSSDKTSDILEKYTDSDKIQIITQSNLGVAAARNNGIACAKGTHIAFLDADDTWYENHLEVMKDLILKYPDAGLYGTFTRVELVNGDTITECNYFKTHEDEVYLEDFFAEYHKDKSVKMFTVITTCISMYALKKTGGFPEGCAIGEDLELSLRAAAYFPVALSKKTTATYKKENSTATKDKSFDADWKFFDTVEDLYKDETIPLTKRENLRKVMGWFTMRRCRHYIIDKQKKKAWKSFFDIRKGSVSKKDLLINLVLLVLPVSLVRRIFMLRWRGKA